VSDAEPGAGRFEPLDPARDEDAAAILAAASFEGSINRGREIVAEARATEGARIRALVVDDRLVAVYILRKADMANEISCLAVVEGERGRGYGRRCLIDAAQLSGRRPLTVETDDDALGFYQQCGFKLVGRRKRPGGTFRYRLGWHRPGQGRASVPVGAPPTSEE
jgi:GNAT superfamily N-acetyltransferase